MQDNQYSHFNINIKVRSCLIVQISVPFYNEEEFYSIKLEVYDDLFTKLIVLHGYALS